MSERFTINGVDLPAEGVIVFREWGTNAAEVYPVRVTEPVEYERARRTLREWWYAHRPRLHFGPCDECECDY